jgi:hypothetical protein
MGPKWDPEGFRGAYGTQNPPVPLPSHQPSSSDGFSGSFETQVRVDWAKWDPLPRGPKSHAMPHDMG